jgi:hypothetical protein
MQRVEMTQCLSAPQQFATVKRDLLRSGALAVGESERALQLRNLGRYSAGTAWPMNDAGGTAQDCMQPPDCSYERERAGTSWSRIYSHRGSRQYHINLFTTVIPDNFEALQVCMSTALPMPQAAELLLSRTA